MSYYAFITEEDYGKGGKKHHQPCNNNNNNNQYIIWHAVTVMGDLTIRRFIFIYFFFTKAHSGRNAKS